jgi:hypothetical protein
MVPLPPDTPRLSAIVEPTDDGRAVLHLKVSRTNLREDTLIVR